MGARDASLNFDISSEKEMPSSFDIEGVAESKFDRDHRAQQLEAVSLISLFTTVVARFHAV